MNTKNNYDHLIDFYESAGAIRGSGVISLPTKRVDYEIENYVVSVLLDDAKRFLGVKSIKVNKNFYDPRRLPSSPGQSAEEIVDDFFRSIEE